MDVVRNYEVQVTADNRRAKEQFRDTDREWRGSAERMRADAAKLYADVRDDVQRTSREIRTRLTSAYADVRHETSRLGRAAAQEFAAAKRSVAEYALAVRSSREALKEAARDVFELGQAVFHVNHQARVLRAGLAPTAISSIGIAAAVAAKQVYDVVAAQRELVRAVSLDAAGNGRSFGEQATLANLQSRLRTGAADLTRAGFSPEQLAAFGRELRAIEDPAVRSARAVQLLGDRARELTPVITDEFFGEAVDGSRRLAASLDSEARTALDRFGSDVRGLTGFIRSLGDEVELLGDRFTQALGVTAAKAWDRLKEAAKAAGAAESGYFLETGQDPRKAFAAGPKGISAEEIRRTRQRFSELASEGFDVKEARLRFERSLPPQSLTQSEVAAEAQADLRKQLRGRLAPGLPDALTAGGYAALEKRQQSEEGLLAALQKQQATTRAIAQAFEENEREDLAPALVDAQRQEDVLRARVEAFRKSKEATEAAKRLGESIARQRLTVEAGLVSGAARVGLDGPLASAAQRARDAATFSNPDGTQQNIGLTTRARLANEQQLRAETLALARKAIDEERKLTRSAFEERLANESTLYQKRLAGIIDLDEEERARDARIRGFEEAAIGRDRERALRGLGRARATTPAGIAAVESSRAAIEIEAESRIADFRRREFDAESQRERERIAWLGANADRLRTFEEQRALERIELERSTQARIEEIQETAADVALRRQEQQYRDFYERIRSGAERSFDALFSRGGGVREFFKSAAQTAIVAPAKQILSAQFAASATRLITGQQVTFAGDDSGPLGRVGGLLQRLGLGSPVFGANRAVTAQDRNTAAVEKLTATISSGVAGGAGAFALAGGGPLGLASILGPGGTAGFAGPLGQRGGGFSPFGSVFGGGFRGGNIRDFFGLGSSISTGAGSATTLSAASAGQVAGSVAKSDFAALAGVGLALDGVKRGGPLGIAEAAGGGALVGYKVGGPQGAAIGASIGAGAALVRTLLFRGQTNIRDRVKQAYGVDITDSNMTGHLTGVVKQQFGGSVDAALASPQVRDLIELYAMGTHQRGAGFAQKANAITLSNSNGQLFQASATYGGRPATTFLGTIPGLSQGGNVTLKLDADATARVLQGQAATVIAGRPELVTTAAARGAETSGGRQGMAAATLDPFSLIA